MRGEDDGEENAPVAVAQRVQVELVGDFCGRHRLRQVLLVGKHEQHSVPELVLGEHAGQLLSCLTDTLAIVTVNHEDETCARAISVLM
jgi:hypothetical protein